ncbi:MAG: hypothetical protein AB8B71_15900 [Paracoccaceae bacterium]
MSFFSNASGRPGLPVGTANVVQMAATMGLPTTIIGVADQSARD